MILNCEFCGKEFKTYCPNRSKHHYCSRECCVAGRKKLITFKCDQCGISVTRPNNSQYKKVKNHFCSLKCANLYQGRNKLKLVCKTCGKIFLRSPSWTNQKAGIYCSISCMSKDEDWIRKASIYGNQVQCDKKGLNKLEKLGNRILDKLNLSYKNQYLINNKICVDVYIPEYNLVIQWDGNYWHGKDIDYNNLDKRQKKRVRLDKSQDAYLKECGYNELRFWEHDVYKNEEEVYDTIKRTIQELTKRV